MTVTEPIAADAVDVEALGNATHDVRSEARESGVAAQDSTATVTATPGSVDLLGRIVPLFISRDDMTKASYRRAWSIHAYVGSNGSGKSLAAVHDTIPSLMAGRRVLSTVRFIDYRDPRPCPGGALCDDRDGHERRRTVVTVNPDNPADVHVETTLTGEIHPARHPLYVPFREYGQLLDWRDGDVLMDEVTGIASSRESHGMPSQVVNYLVQLRRRDVLLRWTAPNWARADKVIREVTQAVTDCSGTMPVTRRMEGDESRLWRDRRLFQWWTYDVQEFDEFTAHRRDEADPLLTQRFWRPGSVAERTYDTLDSVAALGAVNEFGICMVCDGNRRRHLCSCQKAGH